MEAVPSNAFPFTRVKDIAAYRDGVVAVGREGTSVNQLVVLGASLEKIAGPYSLGGLTPTVVTVGQRVAIDVNRDGEVPSSEHLDIAVVGTSQSIEVVQLADANGQPVTSPLFNVLVGGTVKQSRD